MARGQAREWASLLQADPGAAGLSRLRYRDNCVQIRRTLANVLSPPPSSAPPWLRSSARQLAADIRAGAVSSEAVVSACLMQIAHVNPALGAVVQQRAEAALDEARGADRRCAAGEVVGPLHGVPITVKDSFDTASLVSTGGTIGRRNFIPAADATVVSRLKVAGAIVLGKTNTPELTLAYEADNLIYGRTCNPYALSRGTGGSSGGAAAIVAACGSPLDLGSDTAGSIRFPAHCCGVAGLKPTSGRVPRTGHIIGAGGLQQWLTTIGPIARYVEDLELALAIIAGPDGADPHIAPVPLRPAALVELRGLKAAVFVHTSLARATSEVDDAVTRAAQSLASAGVEIEPAMLPDFDKPFAFFPQVFGADGAAGLERFLADLGSERTVAAGPWRDQPDAATRDVEHGAQRTDDGHRRVAHAGAGVDAALRPDRLPGGCRRRPDARGRLAGSSRRLACRDLLVPRAVQFPGHARRGGSRRRESRRAADWRAVRGAAMA